MVKVNIFGAQDIFDLIEPEEALQILKTLIHEDGAIAERVRDLFVDGLREVDVEAIATEVMSDLELLDVDDLWDEDPVEDAHKMVEIVLQPWLDKMKRLRSLDMFEEEMIFCSGIIIGLSLFVNGSEAEVEEWAVDACQQWADDLTEGWKKSCTNPELIVAMENFLQLNSQDDC